MRGEELPRVLKELEHARTNLADAGLDLADNIPSIVIIGDQSTGKSSLLSALTKLPLPHGSGTVTRAPLKIFIQPGTVHKAKLQYRLRKLDGGSEHKTVELSEDAADQRLPLAELPQMIRQAQNDMKKSFEEQPEATWQQYVLGDFNSDCWLLKDDIELTVDVPDSQGSFSIVDLPGLHRPVTPPTFTQDLEDFVMKKISKPNVIILNVMTAVSAIGSGSSNTSQAFVLAHKADNHYKRTLTIFTMSDAVGQMPDGYRDALQAAINKSEHHGCVLVAAKPNQVEDTEKSCLDNFSGESTIMMLRQLEGRGGGFGVGLLLKKLVKLQADMITKLHIPSLISELRKQLEALDKELSRFKSLPESEREAEFMINRLLNDVKDRFRDACKGAPSTADDELITTNMVSAVNAAGISYKAKQSDFIPGILGKKKALEIIKKAAEKDEMLQHPNILSEYTAMHLFLAFHKDAPQHALEYMEAVHTAVHKAISELLQLYLSGYPDLLQAAVAAADELLLEFKPPLTEAVLDASNAYTYVVETLHDEVLYMTYYRLLMLASGILVTMNDKEQAAELHHDKKANRQDAVQGPSANDISDDAVKRKLDQIRRDALPPGTVSASHIMGDAIGVLAMVALTPVMGPFAGILGPSIGVLTTEAWNLCKRMLLKYKAEYQAKKMSNKSTKLAGYTAAEYQDDLVPLCWPGQAAPMTSFELMCKMMNCDPSYVVEALNYYYKEFDKFICESEKKHKFSAAKLQEMFLSCLCRMLCTHYALTESVAKLVRMRLMCTHSAPPDSTQHAPKPSLPNVLSLSLGVCLRTKYEGRMLSLVVGEEQAMKRAELERKRSGVANAIRHLHSAWPVGGAP